jgi:hypothetical protein
MSEWSQQFVVKYDRLSDVFSTPEWYRRHVCIDATPKPQHLEVELWSVANGYFALARNNVLKSDGSGILQFEKPAVLILYIANSLEAVLHHSHKIVSAEHLGPLEEPHPSGVLPLNYKEWTSRFECSESASYRFSDGCFVDKLVFIKPIKVCFLNNEDDPFEMPYLIEVRDEVHRQSDA